MSGRSDTSAPVSTSGADAAGGGSVDSPQAPSSADSPQANFDPASNTGGEGNNNEIPWGPEPGVTGPYDNVDDVRANSVNKKPSYGDPMQRPEVGDYCGGSKYRNATEPLLPRTDSEGGEITYTEYDLDPYDGLSRNGRRMVAGSDGSRYYTDSHYSNWSRFR